MWDRVFDFIKAATDIAALLLSCGAFGFSFYVFLSTIRRNDQTSVKGEFKLVHKRVDDIDSRTTRMETKMEAMPSHADLQNLHDRVSDVRKELGVVGKCVAGLEASSRAQMKSIERIAASVQQLVDNELAEARDAKKRNT